MLGVLSTTLAGPVEITLSFHKSHHSRFPRSCGTITLSST
jgi:hypothetical protein